MPSRHLRANSQTVKFGLGPFLVISLLWHAGQLLLFTTVFKVRSPLGDGSSHASPAQSTLLHYNPQPSPRPLPPVAAVDFQPTQPATLEHAMSIHAPETPSLTGTGKLSARPDLRQRPRTMATDDSRMARSQAKPSTINGSTSAPFDFSPVLKARKILYQPPLPAYPESARKMGTDLNLRLFLRVQASGRVAFVDILKSSGDSITDDLARTYTAQLLFEPAAGVDEGEMAWEFRLQ